MGPGTDPISVMCFYLLKKVLLYYDLFCHPTIVLKNTITEELLSNVCFCWENNTLSALA